MPRGKPASTLSRVPVTPNAQVPAGVPAGSFGYSTTPAADRPEGVARGPFQNSEASVADILAPHRTEPDVDAQVSDAVVQADLDAHEADRRMKLAMQAQSMGMPLDRWEKVVATTPPEALAELITALGEKEVRGLKNGTIKDEDGDPNVWLDGKAMAESGRVNEGDMRALAAQLLPANRRLKYTLLADPEDDDGVSRGISVVLKVNASKKVIDHGFDTNLLKVVFAKNTIPCQFRDSRSRLCIYRTDAPKKLLEHHKFHHPDDWNTLVWQQGQEAADRQAAAMEALVKSITAVNGNTSDDVLNRLADILTVRQQIAAPAEV